MPPLYKKTDQGRLPMPSDFDAELHARPSVYFDGPALVEHVALMPIGSAPPQHGRLSTSNAASQSSREVSIQVEHHTEFVTVTRVTPLVGDIEEWPNSDLGTTDFAVLADVGPSKLVCRVAVLVLGPPPSNLGSILKKFEFGDSAASSIGGGSGELCSDFRVRKDHASRLVLFNKDLNSNRLGRMVRRVYEIETYRSMALLALPEARRLAPLLGDYDARLVDLTNRNLTTPASQHKQLLEEISAHSAQVISATAETRNRFAATVAYAKIVEERIAELRESHVPDSKDSASLSPAALSQRSEPVKLRRYAWRGSHRPSISCRPVSRWRSNTRILFRFRRWRIARRRR
jgi:uncharacterized membrane-anchored protein